MTTSDLILLIILFFLTSAVGVVTGSNSLITVPVMFQFGIDPKIAVATNMFGLTFMNIGATIPFIRRGAIDTKKVTPLILITLVASAIGASLVLFITPSEYQTARFGSDDCSYDFHSGQTRCGNRRHRGNFPAGANFDVYFNLCSRNLRRIYSGGYTTMLTAVYVAFFGMTFTESVASTKLINVFSSAIATLIFMWQGLIDYKLGAILAVTMFIGAYIGAQTVTKLSDIWLKRIFIAVVLILSY